MLENGMTRSIKGSATHQFVEQGKSKFAGLDTDLTIRRLALLNAATSRGELGKLSSVGLHKLKGDLRAFWSIDLNGRWRLLFQLKDGDAFDVHIFDPH
jgi:proteic killer suppression protein